MSADQELGNAKIEYWFYAVCRAIKRGTVARELDLNQDLQLPALILYMYLFSRFTPCLCSLLVIYLCNGNNNGLLKVVARSNVKQANMPDFCISLKCLCCMTRICSQTFCVCLHIDVFLDNERTTLSSTVHEDIQTSV